MNIYPTSYTVPVKIKPNTFSKPFTPIAVPKFGSSSSEPVRNNEKAVFETYIPRPIKFFQRLAAELNRFIFFNSWLPIPGMYRNKFQFADARSKEILSKGLPKDAGILLIGPHPDRKDGNLLCEIYRQANQYPASVLISSEMIQKFGSFIHPSLIKIVKPLFSMMGLVPLNRGARNPQVKEYTIRSIADGKWTTVFPEGDVRTGPRVFPMQKGAVEMAIKAAIQANFKRPIMLVPFAHTWSYRDPVKAEKNFLNRLKTLEDTVLKKRRGQLQDSCPGKNVQDRIFRVGNQIMDYKIKEYGLEKPSNWQDLNFFAKVDYLRTQAILALESKYNLHHRPGRLEHNRLMNIRSAAWKVLASLPEEVRRKNLNSFDDIKCTQDLSYMSTFKPEDLKDYGDGKVMDREMLACYVQRLSALMKLNAGPLGDRVATVKVLNPIDIREMAKEYKKLSTQDEQDEYAIRLTEKLFQKPIQNEVNALRKKVIEWK